MGNHLAICGDPFGQFDDPATPVHSIQGSGSASQLVGTNVIAEDIVTGDYQDTAAGLSGFFLEELSPDGDPATSEVIFVYDNGLAVDVPEAEAVRVRGVVAEFNGLTELSAIDRLIVCSAPAPLPTTSVVLSVAMRSAWEAFEGMRVTVAQTCATSAG